MGSNWRYYQSRIRRCYVSAGPRPSWVDRSQQGRGLGRALFRDGALRVAHAADIIGIRGILVHAISEQAMAFYLALGFDSSPEEPMTLMVTLGDIRHLTT